MLQDLVSMLRLPAPRDDSCADGSLTQSVLTLPSPYSARLAVSFAASASTFFLKNGLGMGGSIGDVRAAF